MPPSSVGWKEEDLGLQRPPIPVSHRPRAIVGEAIPRYIQLSAHMGQEASAAPRVIQQRRAEGGTVERKSWMTRGDKDGKKASESI